MRTITEKGLEKHLGRMITLIRGDGVNSSHHNEDRGRKYKGKLEKIGSVSAYTEDQVTYGFIGGFGLSPQKDGLTPGILPEDRVIIQSIEYRVKYSEIKCEKVFETLGSSLPRSFFRDSNDLSGIPDSEYNSMSDQELRISRAIREAWRKCL